MGTGASRGSAPPVSDEPLVDFAAVKADILKVMDSPAWDDGSYAPLLIRLAWHSSGTFCKADKTGGSNGATMRWTVEAKDPDNAGLEDARRLLEPVRAKHPEVSYADLWILAGCCAIEHTGGPAIDFRGGRKDRPASLAIPPGRLPNPERGCDAGMECDSEGRIKGWEQNAAHVREVFGRMGLGDREMVALICGGHVYGRCHPDSSGYAGAWVENPTRFSNEYAADMFSDKWLLVGHDTKMPDGAAVPEEVRPSPGKRQYMDLSKYEPEEDEEAATRKAPDSKEYPSGKYTCVSDWVNCREKPDTGSPIIGRFVKDDVLNVVEVKVFGTAIRARVERGGWISVIASGGKTLFERQGDLDLGMLVGKYRPVDKVHYYSNPQAKDEEEVKAVCKSCGNSGIDFMGKPCTCSYGKEAQAKVAQNQAPKNELDVTKVELGKDGDEEGAIFGKTDKGYALLFSPSRGLLAEKIVQGYNEKPRVQIKGQTGHQMMLISDMVMFWDPSFCAVLKEYADDEEVLRKDFGLAFKRLTELGCPWDEGGGAGGCPLFCGAN